MISHSKSILLKTFCLLCIINLQGQSIGIVRDSTTNEPVPFANIWIDGEQIGTTSNEDGEFYFKKSVLGRHLILSSIGYKPKRFYVNNERETVLLNPDVIQLKEVVVQNRKEKRNIVGEKIKTSDVRLFFFCDGMPYMKARFFPYKDEFLKTPFISSIEIVTSSNIENATFNLRLYTMNEDGKPDKPVYTDNIIVAVKKGRNLTSIDLTERLIEFPKTGLLIAFEYLIIKENVFELTYTTAPDTNKLTKVMYAPLVGTVPSETPKDSWVYKQGVWTNVERNSSSKQKSYANRYDKLAVRVKLTN